MIESGVVADGHFTSSSEIKDRSARLASVLAGSGVCAGDAVGLMMGNRAEFFEVALAVRTLGAVLVPMSRQLTSSEVGHIVESGGVDTVVTEERLRAVVDDAAPARTTLVVGEGGAYERLVAEAIPWAGEPRPPAEPMFYTSGTTGRPKGVRKKPSTPAQTAAMGRWITEVFGLENGMRTIVANPLYHSAGFGYAMLVFRQRGLIVLEERFDPERLLALVERYRITHLQLVPTMMYRLLRLEPEVRARYDVSSLRHVLHGAGPCALEVKRGIIDWWGPVVREYYGSTETGALVSCTSQEWLARPGTVGKARDGAVVRICDEQGRHLPPGEVGTVYASHPSTPDFTYHEAPEKRAEIERDGLVTCGDLGYLDEDGYLWIVDRRTDLILCGGVNVYPAEIEQHLQQLPGIIDCAVVAAPDAEHGQIPVAYVELEPGRRLTLEETREFLGNRLARPKLPRRLEVVARLPRDDTGKVRRTMLLDLAAKRLTSHRAPGNLS